MKKTYEQLTDTVKKIIVENDDGTTLTFLNGLLEQMSNNQRFIPARGPVQGTLMLIIADYAHYRKHEVDIQEWIAQFSGGIRQEGMVLTFDHDADRTAFLLRWG